MAEPFEAEIKKYTEALAADPKSRAFVPLSDVYRKLGRYDEAILVAKEGVQNHPHYMGGKMALARAYFENGELDLAETLLEEVLNFASDNLIANRLLAQVYLQKGGKERALPLLQCLKAADPSDAWANQQLKGLEASKASPVPVEPAPSPNMESKAQAPTQTATLAELYRSQGHADRALEVYRLLLRSEPTNSKWLASVDQLEKEMAGRREPSEQTTSRRRKMLEKLLSRVEGRRRKAA